LPSDSSLPANSDGAPAGPADKGGFDFVLRREALAVLRHKTGVIVDANPANRSAMRAMLSAIGMTQVAQAGSAADALRRVADRPADIILCDYQLEDGRDGQQLLEEMRTRHLIPLSTAFVVITRESRYQSVVSVAELAPDDYLLKPFSPQDLLERLEAVLARKHAFRHAHEHLENNEATKAIEACDHVGLRYSHYRLDALRLKAQTLMAVGRTVEAEDLYRQILAMKAVPWAKMGLALASHRSGKLDEAADLVVDILAHHPTYLAAYDLAAQVDEERGRLDDAQRHLQAAVEHAPHGIARQRQLGRIAAENNDVAAAERAMATVISRSSGSSLCQVEDFTRLARLQIAQGRATQAVETAAALRRELSRNPAATMTGHALAALAHCQLGRDADAEAAAGRAAAGAEAIGHDADPRQLVDVAQALIVSGAGERGHALLRRAIAQSEGDDRFASYMDKTLGAFKETAGIAASLHDDVRQRMIQVNNEAVRLGRAGDLEGAIRLFREAASQMPSVQMLANAAKAILAKMHRDGWDVELAAEARGYIGKGLKQGSGDKRIESATAAYEQVMAKFGIRQHDLPWKGK
jgi:DNA-binding response OmpR family regulator/predicted negative regulator of RcsB-dependent stress response